MESRGPEGTQPINFWSLMRSSIAPLTFNLPVMYAVIGFEVLFIIDSMRALATVIVMLALGIVFFSTLASFPSLMVNT